MSDTITCLTFRRTCQADPHHADGGLEAHRRGCPACARFAADLLDFDRRLAAALRVPAPERLRAKVVFERSLRGRRRLRRLAVAASLVLALAAGFGLYLDRGAAMTVTDLVAHLRVDPLHQMPDDPDADADLARIAQALALDWQGGVGDVVNAKPCVVDGHQGLHLLVEDHGMRLNVFVMPGIEVARAGRVDGAAMPGMVMQTPRGVIAVFGPKPATLGGYAERLRRAVSWG